MEPPQGGAATEPSRLALYGPQEQEKMLRLLREKGLQTLLSGDTLEERNDGEQALLRPAQLGADENAKASERQDGGTVAVPPENMCRTNIPLPFIGRQWWEIPWRQVITCWQNSGGSLSIKVR